MNGNTATALPMVTDPELTAILRGNRVLFDRFLAAGCTCIRARRVGPSIVIHGFRPEIDPLVTHENESNEEGYWFRFGAQFEPIERPALLTAYRSTAIQHLS